VRVVVSRRLAAPPERVWPWLAEPDKHVKTLPPSVSQVEVHQNGDIACVVSALGVQEAMTVRVVETDPPRRLVEKRVDGKRESTTTFDIAAAEGGGSDVTLTSELDLPRLVASFAKGPIEQGLKAQLELLDQLSAAEAG
jgi:carbon monoxide dehydrogenase subunit G